VSGVPERHEVAEALDWRLSLRIAQVHGAALATKRRRPWSRSPVTSASRIGKQSNRLKEVQAGLVESLDDVVNQYDGFYRRGVQPARSASLGKDWGSRNIPRTRSSLGAVALLTLGGLVARPASRSATSRSRLRTPKWK
jgi:hypothetical protein